MIAELQAAIRSASRDSSVTAVVLRSESPRAFCVGADLKESLHMSADEARERHIELTSLLREVRGMPEVTVAAVGGMAVGGGLELALSCDLVVAGEEAVFALPEVRVGLIPSGGGSRLLVHRVGVQRAKEMILFGYRMGAGEAKAAGMVARVVPTPTLDAACTELVAGLCQGSPVALGIAKRIVDSTLELSAADSETLEHRGWVEAVSSPDYAEGLAAFLEKRSPAWARS